MNIPMEKKMEKEKYIMIMGNYNLKVIFLMVYVMEAEKNIMIMENWNLKVYLLMDL